MEVVAEDLEGPDLLLDVVAAVPLVGELYALEVLPLVPAELEEPVAKRDRRMISCSS